MYNVKYISVLVRRWPVEYILPPWVDSFESVMYKETRLRGVFELLSVRVREAAKKFSF